MNRGDPDAPLSLFGASEPADPDEAIRAHAKRRTRRSFLVGAAGRRRPLWRSPLGLEDSRSSAVCLRRCVTHSISTAHCPMRYSVIAHWRPPFLSRMRWSTHA